MSGTGLWRCREKGGGKSECGIERGALIFYAVMSASLGPLAADKTSARFRLYSWGLKAQPGFFAAHPRLCEGLSGPHARPKCFGGQAGGVLLSLEFGVFRLVRGWVGLASDFRT